MTSFLPFSLWFLILLQIGQETDLSLKHFTWDNMFLTLVPLACGPGNQGHIYYLFLTDYVWPVFYLNILEELVLFSLPSVLKKRPNGVCVGGWGGGRGCIWLMLNDNRKMFSTETGGIKLTKCGVYLWKRDWGIEKQNSLWSFSSGQRDMDWIPDAFDTSLQALKLLHLLWLLYHLLPLPASK